MSRFNFGNFAAIGKENGISFEGQGKKWGDEAEAKELIDAIVKCTTLEFLHLEGNTLGVDAARGIGEALKKHPEFKKALFKDLFTGRMKAEIPKALEHLGKGMIAAGAQLTVLDCSDNALGPNGMAGLVDLLKSPTCYSLQELKLNNCGLGIGGGTMLAQALSQCHASSVTAGTPLRLKVFIAGRNRLENEGVEALSQFFRKVGSLEELSIPQNGINSPGISPLSKSLNENENLKILNLNDNTICANGARALAPTLELLQNLEEINLGDCLLKTKGAVFIGEALQDGHPHLKKVDLGFNEIGPNGGISIASAMLNKTELETLNLNGNQFGKDVRKNIAEILDCVQLGKALVDLDEDQSDEEDEEEEGEVVSSSCSSDAGSDEESENYEEYGSNYEEGGDYENKGDILDQQIVDNSVENSFYNLNIVSSKSIEHFCALAHPNAADFNSLEEKDKINSFRQYLQNVPEKDYLTQLVFTIIKCSAISDNCKEALDISTELYKDCYDFAETTKQVSRVNNFFLAQLGFLKLEDKTFKPAYNVHSCRIALHRAIEKNSFSAETAEMYKLFLGKSNTM